MDKPFFQIELDISNYNLIALNDTMRMLVIQIFVQILFVLRNPEVDLLSNIFIENTLFIILGTLSYWLIFNHIILFKNNKIGEHYFQKIYTEK